MTNEEAIDVLMYLWRHEISERNTEGEIRRALNMGMAAIKREQRWIPVSEKLPEEDGCYLVTTTGTNNDIIDIAYYTEDIWHKASRIKAWMPLPEPYKVESEDKGQHLQLSCKQVASKLQASCKAESEDKLDGDPVDIDKAVEHYEGTLETLKGIDLEVDR